MKKVIAILIIAGMVFSFASTANADSSTTNTDGPVKKLGRGLANIVTSPFALIRGMDDAQQEGGVFAGFTWGILQGTVNVVKRIAVGAYETVTFPIPLPADYKPILTDPEFIWQPD